MILYGRAYPTTIPGVELMGALGGLGGLGAAAPNAKIKALQTALADMARFTGNGAYDPGAIDGILGTRTRTAAGLALNRVVSSLSSYLKYPALAASATLITGVSDQADTFLKNEGDKVAAGIRVWMSQQTAGSEAASAGGGSAPMTAEWYKTTNGKIVLALGAGALLLLLLRR